MNEAEKSSDQRAIDTPEEHQRLIKSQWRDFAAFAWGRYQREGRGAVVVDLTNPSAAGGAIRVTTYYVADASERLEELGGWPSEEIEEVIRDYDPEEEVVFIFVRADGDIVHYRVSDELMPPDA
ncbi:MAG TPA: hypothetical protein VJH03_27270 [Blastocatellia bacterium]|nr:hypothetical protein [Blastocatellia bacterium]